MIVNLIGKILFFSGSCALGIAFAMDLQKRLSTLREMQKSLEVLDRELGFALLPVEGLLSKVANNAKNEVKFFFDECIVRFASRQEERLEDIWKDSLKVELPSLAEEDKAIIEEIGSVLGRYDGESQQKAFQNIRNRLEENLEKVKSEIGQKIKIYVVLGVVFGVFFVVVF